MRQEGKGVIHCTSVLLNQFKPLRVTEFVENELGCKAWNVTESFPRSHCGVWHIDEGVNQEWVSQDSLTPGLV